MVENTCVFGINSIHRHCKAYKSIIKRRFHHKKSSPSSKDNPQRQNRIQQEPNADTNNMNGIHGFRMNGDALRNNEQNKMSSRLGCCLCRQRSFDNLFFRSVASTSRKASSKKTHHTKSKSGESCDFVAAPSSCNTSGSLPSHLYSGNASSSRRSNTPIMYSNSSGMLKPPPIEKKLECTLEELCYGCKKKIKITRDVLTDTGGIVQEEEILTINVLPGWKKGTKIKFEGKGNERPGAYREDIVFFISEKRHQLFRREGDDLELCVEIPLLKALTGCTIPVPLLGGEEMSLVMDEVICPGYQMEINGQGMPISKEQGERGNLRITFLVEFPTDLTDKQRSEVFDILRDSC